MSLPYLSFSRYSLEELEALEQALKRLLIIEQDRSLAQLYQHYLEHLPVEIKLCLHPTHIGPALKDHQPHVTIVNTDLLIDSHSGEVLDIRRYHPNMHIIAVGSSLERMVLHQLMDLGVSSYINRQITQPKDMIEAVVAMLAVAI